MNALHRLYHNFQAVIAAHGRMLENKTHVGVSNLLVLAGMSERLNKGMYELNET